MEVRPVRPEEIDLAGSLTVAAYATFNGAPVGDEYRAELADVAGRMRDAEVLVAVEGDELLGSVTYVSDASSPLAEFDTERTAGIRMLAVEREARGRGIGRALVAACIERAVAAGCDRVVLHTTPQMVDAERLYLRMGFERAPQLDFEPVPGLPLQAYRYWIDVAALLAEARATRRALPGLPAHLIPGSLEDAYRAQDRLVMLLGRRGVGWKLSATTAAVQQALGLSSPMAGRLLEGHVHPTGTEVQLENYIGHPSIAAVIVLRLGADLTEGPFNAPAVAEAVSDMSVALQILDSRFEHPSEVGPLALVADIGLAGELVVGEGRPLQGLWDSRDLPVYLLSDGELLAEGLATDALGGPLHVLAWLAGHLAARRQPLRAGDLVATGSCTGLIPLPAGRPRLEARVGSIERPWLSVEATCL